jgi:hypothetical protein
MGHVPPPSASASQNRPLPGEPGRVLIIAAFLLGAGAAQAGAPDRPEPVETPIRRSLVLEPGRCDLRLSAEVNLSVRELADPVSLAPDAWCGIAPRLALGVVHSASALSLIDSGHGLCLGGEEHGCGRPYDGVGIDALRDLTGRRAVSLAARVRLVARSLEPFKPSLRLGALLRLRSGRFAVRLDPHLLFGLANQPLGNRDAAALPLWLELELGQRILLHWHSGVRGEIEGFDEKFAVPIGLGALVQLTRHWDLGFEGGFSKLLGPQNTFKHRHAALSVTYRLASARPRPPEGWYTAD